MELTRLPKIKVSNLQLDLSNLEDLEAPITGHEIREACKRHTVYKIYVHHGDRQGWFITRRYREFHKLRADLKKLFPSKEFILPPKRYFGDNFEPRFLNSRRQGLQGFLYMITRQKDVSKSAPVVDFLLLNNPPSTYEDVGQCRTVITQLEAELNRLRLAKTEHNTSITTSNGQIAELHNQKLALLAALRFERQQHGKKPYPGDDLSLMFEYRSLPEVSRVDVSSFLVRKPAAGITRRAEDKARKPEDETRVPREEIHVVNRGRAHTPPASDYGRYESRNKEPGKRSQPYIEIQSPQTKCRHPFSSSDSVASPSNSEFKSFYQSTERRKSMPGAVEFHKVNHMLKAGNAMRLSETAARSSSLTVPGGNDIRRRSYSTNYSQGEQSLDAGLHPAINRVKIQASMETPKRNIGWTSLKDLRKLKGKAA